ncbi:hypothetical protein NDU88_003399 [Pleurodeles waltl]|uniref:Endosialin n=1 Tax=Pleurodeles waltl TaxID=8319 RepID=A0AAV7MQF8_PLEWA|nr:hypothetical protein NDU88_003399 [Pleurodeles waltl]
MAVWLLLILGVLGRAQDLREQDASCSAEGCYAIYFQRHSFLESWRSCRERGGTLATLRHHEEAALVEELFHGLGLAEDQATMRFWIGLQRQPRQCSSTRPLRGFTWVTGDQDTLYTNWLRPEGAPGGTCAIPRCVVMSYGSSRAAQAENFKWLDGSCTLPVDGFVCKFLYKGMCPAMVNEGGPVMYTTPFQLVSRLLTYVPFGSVANVPCGGSIPDLSVLCMLKEDGTIGWSKDGPYCPEEQQQHELGMHQLAGRGSCDVNNGGCEHICVDEGEEYFCECDEGFALMEDGQNCAPADHCESNPCEYDCTSHGHRYLCSCPEGQERGPDGRRCQDIDECAESSCDQLCINLAGGYQCQCHVGYHMGDEQCQDTDECAILAPCEHSCENTEGSYACHCHLGYSPAEEDPHHCVDNDECRIADMCQQMCVNYIGGFECYCNDGYELDSDATHCHPVQEAEAAMGEHYPFLHTTLVSPSLDTWPYDYSEEETEDEGLEMAATLEPETTSQERTTVPRLPTSAPNIFSSPAVVKTTNRFKEWTTQLVTSEAITTAAELIVATSNEPSPDDLPEEEEEVADEPLTESVSVGSEVLVPTATSTRSQESGGTSALSSAVEPTDPLVEYQDHTTSTVASTVAPASSSAPLPGSEDSQRAEKRDNRWLLVALLVPLCIFLVIMLALGIVYCTRCSGKAKPKSVTECYHWITNKNPSPASGKPGV